MRKITDVELDLAWRVARVMGAPLILFPTGDTPERTIEWPLEHDCLEWLRERGFYIEVAIATYVRVFISKGDIIYEKRGKETLEALYRCIIEINAER